jgi:hypothetical protein
MKRLHAEEGLKINPIYLLNSITDINENNWREVVNRLFTPGLFVSKNSSGVFDHDFFTELVNPYTQGQTDYQGIKINISTIGYPSRAFTKDGKFISLYSSFTITPYTLSLIAGNYGLYIKPSSVAIESVSYLPNYTIGTEKKDLILEYLVDFQIIKSGELVPEDCIQVATFTMTIVRGDPSYGVISNLVDTRAFNRAYLNRELYDFYPSDFLKHDYVVTAGAGGVGVDDGKIYYNTNEQLKGSLTLYSAKQPNSRINVIFDGTQEYPIIVFPDAIETYILYIEVSLTEFFSANVITKPLLVTNATTYTPSADKIVVGVRTINSIPQEEIGDPIGED